MLAIIVGIVLITIGIFVWNQNKFPKNQEQEQPLVAQPQEGSLAPDFILSNLQGERVQLANLKGRPVLLNFWATWCPPCREEMPLLEAVYRERREELEVLTVNLQEEPEVIEAFQKENGYTFPVLLDREGKVASQYWIRGIPTTLIIDSQGIIRAIRSGALREEDLEALLDEVR